MISIVAECSTLYDQLKVRKLKYIIFALSDDNKSIIIHKSSESPNYEDFLREFPSDDCTWAVYRLENQGENKICFYSWLPDGANVEVRIMYTSFNDVLRRHLAGVAVDIYGTDASDLSYKLVMNQILSFK
ncbi:hypothetical protein B0H17DRAFT_58649 [Mycena rosella]|uniref:Cofilin n=1 Tax=Mycena rosella TaxID=1033263 RepID=A0AAD7GCC7_MYCRO|nr:hypothetical protein B0H17DRAFT_58649 [Mycena rosella]